MVIAGMFSSSSKFSVNPLLAVYFPSSIHVAASILYGPAEVPKETESNCQKSARSTTARCQLLLLQMGRLWETWLEASRTVHRAQKAWFKNKVQETPQLFGMIQLHINFFSFTPHSPWHLLEAEINLFGVRYPFQNCQELLSFCLLVSLHLTDLYIFLSYPFQDRRLFLYVLVYIFICGDQVWPVTF